MKPLKRDQLELYQQLTHGWQPGRTSQHEVHRQMLMYGRGAAPRRVRPPRLVLVVASLTLGGAAAAAVGGWLIAPSPPQVEVDPPLAPVAAPSAPSPVATPAPAPSQVTVEEAASEPSGAPPADERAASRAMPQQRDPRWAEVAEALRSGDHARAEKTLRQLAGKGSAAERDSATLALAQLWLNTGRREAAQVRLRQLAASGSSVFVRQRARALLDAQAP